MQTAMYCTRCGTKLDNSARFCTSCGAPTTTGTPHSGVGGPQAAYATTRRLRKVRNGKKISGVCLGFAEYFEVDVTLMRIIWVALLLMPPHIGLLAYIICVIVLPKE